MGDINEKNAAVFERLESYLENMTGPTFADALASISENGVEMGSEAEIIKACGQSAGFSLFYF